MIVKKEMEAAGKNIPISEMVISTRGQNAGAKANSVRKDGAF